MPTPVGTPRPKQQQQPPQQQPPQQQPPQQQKQQHETQDVVFIKSVRLDPRFNPVPQGRSGLSPSPVPRAWHSKTGWANTVRSRQQMPESFSNGTPRVSQYPMLDRRTGGSRQGAYRTTGPPPMILSSPSSAAATPPTPTPAPRQKYKRNDSVLGPARVTKSRSMGRPVNPNASSHYLQAAREKHMHALARPACPPSLAVWEPNKQNPTDPVSMLNWKQLKTAPRPPPAAVLADKNGRLAWQIQMARHLDRCGIFGPFEIGDFLCHVSAINGDIQKVANWVSPKGGQPVWMDLKDSKLLDNTGGESFGQPVWNSTGAFVGFRESETSLTMPDPQYPCAYPGDPSSLKETDRPALRSEHDPMWYTCSNDE